MTSPTRGVNGKLGRKPIPADIQRSIILLKSNGLSTKDVAIGLGVGESTVKRYAKKTATVAVKSHVRGDKVIKSHKRGPRNNPTKKPPETMNSNSVKPATAELTSEQIEYINNIYRSDRKAGTVIGNFLIRLGRMLGGHNPV